MKPNTNPGKFIVFEGVDGSGKSKQSELLAEALSQKGFYVTLTHEPYKAINLRSRKDIIPQDRQREYIEDRKHHLEEVIIPNVKDGGIVVCDRYFLSALAYGVSEKIEEDNIILWHEEILKEYFILPDIIFIIDIPADEAIERIDKRNRKKNKDYSYFESVEKLARVREVYLDIYKNNKYNLNLFFVDGRLPIEAVHNQVLNKTLELFK